MHGTFFQRNRAALTALLVTMAIGAFLAAYAACSLLRSKYYHANMPSTVATVTKVNVRRNEGRYFYRQYVTYTVGEITYKNVLAAYQSYVLHKGDSMRIRYNPVHPERIAAENQTYYSRWLCIGGGFLLVAFAVWGLSVTRKQDERALQLSGAGVHVEATVTGYARLPGKLEETRRITVECAWYDSHALCTRTFQSASFRPILPPDELIGASISVLVDVNDYENYRVETQTISKAVGAL